MDGWINSQILIFDIWDISETVFGTVVITAVYIPPDADAYKESRYTGQRLPQHQG